MSGMARRVSATPAWAFWPVEHAQAAALRDTRWMLARVTRVLFVAWFALLPPCWRWARDRVDDRCWIGLYALVLGSSDLAGHGDARRRRIAARHGAARARWRDMPGALFGEWTESTAIFGWRMPALERGGRPLPRTSRACAASCSSTATSAIAACGIHDEALAQARSRLCRRQPGAGLREHRRLHPADRTCRASHRDATGLAPVIVATAWWAGRARLAALARRAQAQRRHRRGRAPDHHRNAHRGTWLAGLAMAANARQMRVDSAWMKAWRHGSAHVAGLDHQLVERVRPDRLPAADGCVSRSEASSCAAWGTSR